MRFVLAASDVAGADEDVKRRQLGDHLRDDIRQLAAIGDAFGQRGVLGAYRRPVQTVHVAVIEIVALETPRLDEHLPPLVARIEP